jgi:hypothetical protein
MPSQQPTLEQRHNSVDQGQGIFSLVGPSLDHVVLISQNVQVAVGAGAESWNRSARSYAAVERSLQSLCRGISYSAKADVSDAVAVLLTCDRYHCLAVHTSPTVPWLSSTKVRFIDLHNAGRNVSRRPDRAIARFVQPCPRSSVTTTIKT